MTTPTSERVFSGIQPSGLPHLGNYLGAFRNWIALQERGDAIYCIVDYHALTSTHDSEAIRATPTTWRSRCSRLAWIPSSSILFRQSDRPEHAELAYLLSTVVPVGLGRADAELQGEERDQPRRRQPRAADVPGAADGRHRDLPRTPRAGRQGPGGPPGAGTRDRARLEPALRRVLRRAGRGLHRVARDPGHGRRPEDVEVTRQRRSRSWPTRTRSENRS